MCLALLVFYGLAIGLSALGQEVPTLFGDASSDQEGSADSIQWGEAPKSSSLDLFEATQEASDLSSASDWS